MIYVVRPGEIFPVNMSDVDKSMINGILSDGFYSYNLTCIIDMNFNGAKDNYYNSIYNNVTQFLRDRKLNKILEE